MTAFSLEQLSKIKNATENTNILDFFSVLDNASLNESSSIQNHILYVQDLREDVVKPFSHPELIVKNFPRATGEYLQVPRVV
jgi:aspartyl/glutamyl-tRNA(Asn/Gln) amidotransferase C subunit